MAKKSQTELFVPLDINLVNFLPKYEARQYTKLEAMFSIQLDSFRGNKISVAFYARVWKWSRKKVSKFIDDLGVEILYESPTSKKQNQKGQIGLQIRDRSGTDQGQIRFIDLKDIASLRSRSGTDKGQIRGRSGSTTIKEERINNKNKTTNGFDLFYSPYPKKMARGDAEKAFKVISPDSDLIQKMVAAIDNQKKSKDWLKDNGKWIPLPASWLRGKRWDDEVEISEEVNTDAIRRKKMEDEVARLNAERDL